MHVRLICAIKFYLLSYLLTYLLKYPKSSLAHTLTLAVCLVKRLLPHSGLAYYSIEIRFVFFICECSKKFSASTCMCMQNHSALIEFNHDIVLFFYSLGFRNRKRFIGMETEAVSKTV